MAVGSGWLGRGPGGSALANSSERGGVGLGLGLVDVAVAVGVHFGEEFGDSALAVGDPAVFRKRHGAVMVEVALGKELRIKVGLAGFDFGEGDAPVAVAVEAAEEPGITHGADLIEGEAAVLVGVAFGKEVVVGLDGLAGGESKGQQAQSEMVRFHG